MDLEQQLGVALAPCRPAPALRAAVLARLAPTARPASNMRRGGRRTILFGTVLVVAAAAAMLVIRLTDMPPAVATLPPGEAASAAFIEPVADAAETPRADTGSSNASGRTTLAGPPPRTYTVQVLPPRLPGDDPVVLAALNEFYAAALRELDAVPGLVLLAAGDSASAADYRLTFNGGFEDAATLAAMLKEGGQAQPVPPAVRLWRMQLSVESRRAPPVSGPTGVDAASGTRTLTLVDGRSVVSASGQADVVDLNIIPSQLQQRMAEVTGSAPAPPVPPAAPAAYGSGAMAGVVNLVLNRSVEGIRLDVEYGASGEVVANPDALNPQQPDGYTVVYQHAVMGSPLQDPADLAATEIERLRMAVLPADAELASKLRARMIDASQPFDRRYVALQLLASQEHGMENPETIRGALVLLPVAPNASRRALVWNLLRGRPHPAVLQTMLDMLGTERNATLRLEIITTLTADYRSAPAAQAALKMIAANDPDALVRNVAERGVSGEASWREYVATIITDARLTPAERFAPLDYLIQADQGQDLRNLLDAQTLQALVAVLPPLLEDGPNEQNVDQVLSELRGVDSPLVVDLVLAGLDRDVEWSTRSQLVSLLGGHRDDPRARQRLEQIAAGEDPKLRALAAALLKMPATPGR